MLRYFVMLACLCIFTACERASELTKSPDPLGDFRWVIPLLWPRIQLSARCRALPPMMSGLQP